MKRLAVMLLPGLALFAGAAGNLRAGDGDWRSLLGNSPFGAAAPAAPAAAGGLEFRGVVAEEGGTLVNLYNPATKTAIWLPVNGQAPGIEVNAYDAGAGKLQVTQAGRSLWLSLKQARIALVSDTVSLQLASAPDAEAASVPEFMRNLPPEARKMLEEVRRRRALRPPFPGTEPEAVPPERPVQPAR